MNKNKNLDLASLVNSDAATKMGEQHPGMDWHDAGRPHEEARLRGERNGGS